MGGSFALLFIAYHLSKWYVFDLMTKNTGANTIHKIIYFLCAGLINIIAASFIGKEDDTFLTKKTYGIAIVLIIASNTGIIKAISNYNKLTTEEKQLKRIRKKILDNKAGNEHSGME